jgi:hydrogenase expression/formation protein HypE
MLPIGKLPPDQLFKLIGNLASLDPSVLLGPGIGRDCAVVELDGDQLLVAKSDPITFTADEIGWYAVHVNANDVATTGAAPRWFLSTLLLPQTIDSPGIEAIFEQMRSACADIGATMVGGHTEVTYDLSRPIVSGTLLGLVPRDRLVLPTGAQPGDAVIVTKRLAVEATAILAREKLHELSGSFDAVWLARCRRFLHEPGISVVADAQLAAHAGRVHAMHDPTEGGLATALTELAAASQVTIEIDASSIPVYAETQALCRHYGLDPWGVIASGSLLIAAEAADAGRIVETLRAGQVEATLIGRVTARSEQPIVTVKDENRVRLLPAFARDEIARLFE